MTTDQYSVFLKYWGMGDDRSLSKLFEALRQECDEDKAKKTKSPAMATLELWSRKYGWQALVEKMDEEANQKLYAQAIGAAKSARVDILKIFRAVVLRFATQLKENKDREITSADIATFWRMARAEMGLSPDTPGEGASATVKVNPDGSFDLTARVRKYEDPE